MQSRWPKTPGNSATSHPSHYPHFRQRPHPPCRPPSYHRCQKNTLLGITPQKNWGNGKHRPFPICLSTPGGTPVPHQTPQFSTHDSDGRGNIARFSVINMSLVQPSAVLHGGHIPTHWRHHTASAACNGTNKRGWRRSNPNSRYHPGSAATTRTS